ncbi:MAG: hypothetical protein V8R85_05675 [Frisingicoccus sp.]
MKRKKSVLSKIFQRQLRWLRGTQVGWVYYQINEATIERFPIYTAETVNTKTFFFCLETMLRQWLAF